MTLLESLKYEEVEDDVLARPALVDTTVALDEDEEHAGCEQRIIIKSAMDGWLMASAILST